MEIYKGAWGTPLRRFFTFVIPVLIVVNVPARIMAQSLSGENLVLAGFALLATGISLAASRWLFVRALESYRSASS
jgi:ABC-2 type transport system permease protein